MGDRGLGHHYSPNCRDVHEAHEPDTWSPHIAGPRQPPGDGPPPRRFLGISVTDGDVERITDMTSREFMHAHKDRFDDRMMADAFAAKVGVPADSDSAKVQAEGSDAAVLPPSVIERIDAMWADRIAPVTGHSDFASLAADVEARG